MSSFPTEIQRDSMQCGTTCLQMISEFYGKNYSSDYLSKLCSPTKEGVSLHRINESANKLGFNTICVRIVTNVLLKNSSTCILHWNQNHFVVVKTEDIHPPKTGISVHFCVLSLMAMQN